MTNSKIRFAIFESGLKHYQVAEAMGVADETFSRWLRHELPEDKTQLILDTINRIREAE